ncbi:MAG: hypothetical protein JNM98_18525 [Rhodocyclaceae bacterium]|nr:hypothetical protein [Rhodocyclaceae bacterium]
MRLPDIVPKRFQIGIGERAHFAAQCGHEHALRVVLALHILGVQDDGFGRLAFGAPLLGVRCRARFLVGCRTA